jgi:hypothetical protein
MICFSFREVTPMTRTEASHLATTIAHDLAQLAPSATRYAVLHKRSDNTYAVLARRGAETVVIAHPDAWTGDEASWQRAKAATVAALAQQKRLRPRPPVRAQLTHRIYWRRAALVGLLLVWAGILVAVFTILPPRRGRITTDVEYTTGHVRGPILCQGVAECSSKLLVQVEGDPRLSLALMEGILKHQRGHTEVTGVNLPNQVTIIYSLPDPDTGFETTVVVGVSPPASEMVVVCVNAAPNRAEVICQDLVRRYSAS